MKNKKKTYKFRHSQLIKRIFITIVPPPVFVLFCPLYLVENHGVQWGETKEKDFKNDIFRNSSLPVWRALSSKDRSAIDKRFVNPFCERHARSFSSLSDFIAGIMYGRSKNESRQSIGGYSERVKATCTGSSLRTNFILSRKSVAIDKSRLYTGHRVHSLS